MMLVAAGHIVTGFSNSAELYDSVSGIWSATGSLNTGRFAHTATLLTNGKVLVAGGGNNSGYLTSAELYDPGRGIWSFTGNLNRGRDAHTATLLPDGRVLVVAGFNNIDDIGRLSSAELYDPVTGTWATTGSLNTARYYHTATLLPNGGVLWQGK
jgi:hypothetical protein